MQSSSAAASFWRSVLGELKGKAALSQTDPLERDVRVLELTKSALRIGVPVEAIAAWNRKGVFALLDSAITKRSEGERELCVVPITGAPLPLPLDPTHTLEHFIASPANQDAYDAARRVAEGKGSRRAPLVLEGERSSGKTHLLRAVAQRIAATRGAGRVRCLDAAQMAYEMIDAIRESRIDAFRERYRSCDALLLDDLDHLEGCDATQADLVGTLDALIERGADVVVTQSSASATGISPALRHRLASEPPVRLAPPEWETRVAIVMDRGERWGVRVEPEAASFLVGELDGALDRVDALLTRLMTHPLCADGLTDVDLLRQALGSGPQRTLRIAPEAVVGLVARHFNLRLRDLRSATRSPRITTPRQIAMYLLRRLCGLSYPEIGQRFGRHHTTALHSYRQVTRQIEHNGSLRATVRILEKDLLRTLEAGE